MLTGGVDVCQIRFDFAKGVSILGMAMAFFSSQSECTECTEYGASKHTPLHSAQLAQLV